MMVVKAVIFDVGGVLVTAPQPIIASWEKKLGLPKGAIAIAFVHGAPENAFCRMERGEIPLSEFCIQFEGECQQMAVMRGIEMPPLSVKELFAQFRKDMAVVPEMFEAVRKLKKAGYKIGIITNNWIDDIHSTKSPAFNFGDLFDAVLESSRIGMRKPDEKIYQLACKKLGVHPQEVVFLDDLGVNLKSASRLGMKTILVKNPIKALEELWTILQDHGDPSIELQTTQSKL